MSLFNSGALPIILQHESITSHHGMLVVKLLSTSKTLHAAVMEHCVGKVDMHINFSIFSASPIGEIAIYIQNWLSKYGILLQSLKLHYSTADDWDDESVDDLSRAISQGLGQATPAGKALPLQRLSIGGLKASILDNLQLPHLIRLDLHNACGQCTSEDGEPSEGSEEGSEDSGTSGEEGYAKTGQTEDETIASSTAAALSRLTGLKILILDIEADAAKGELLRATSQLASLRALKLGSTKQPTHIPSSVVHLDIGSIYGKADLGHLTACTKLAIQDSVVGPDEELPPNVKHLIVLGSGPISGSHAWDPVKQLSHLERLEVSVWAANNSERSNPNGVLELARSCTELSALCLLHGDTNGSNVTTEVAKAWSTLPLVRLDLRPVDWDLSPSVLAKLSKVTMLTCLTIQGELGEISAEQLAGVLQSLTNLRHLMLDSKGFDEFVEIEAGGMQYLASTIASLPNLVHLYITCNEGTANHGLAPATKLTSLTFAAQYNPAILDELLEQSGGVAYAFPKVDYEVLFHGMSSLQRFITLDNYFGDEELQVVATLCPQLVVFGTGEEALNLSTEAFLMHATRLTGLQKMFVGASRGKINVASLHKVLPMCDDMDEIDTSDDEGDWAW